MSKVIKGDYELTYNKDKTTKERKEFKEQGLKTLTTNVPSVSRPWKH